MFILATLIQMQKNLSTWSTENKKQRAAFGDTVDLRRTGE